MMIWVLLWCLGIVCGLSDIPVEYPNPQVQWRSCGQQKPSYVCDPEFILNSGEAEKLDNLAKEMQTSTSCLCSSCPEDRAVQIGIYLNSNFSADFSPTGEDPGKRFAEILRKKWNFGNCDDDILIVLFTELNISRFSLGPTVQSILPEETAAQIVKDCQIHFDSGYFYQGLESIVNSFNDIIVKEQKKNYVGYNQLMVALLSGFGALFIIASCAVAFHFRQIKRRKKSCSNIYESDMVTPDQRNRSAESDEQLEKLNKTAEEEIEDV